MQVTLNGPGSQIQQLTIPDQRAFPETIAYRHWMYSRATTNVESPAVYDYAGNAQIIIDEEALTPSKAYYVLNMKMDAAGTTLECCNSSPLNTLDDAKEMAKGYLAEFEVGQNSGNYFIQAVVSGSSLQLHQDCTSIQFKG